MVWGPAEQLVSNEESGRTSEAERLLSEFLDRRAEGRRPDFEALCRDHASLADELRRLYLDWSDMADRLDDLLPGSLGDGAFFHRAGASSDGDAESGPPAFEDGPGMIIGDFRLVHLLGRGGMGRVWEAE